MEKFNLGIHGSHNAAIAISLGGKVLEVVELERWVGIKNAAFWYYYPIENAEEILNNILDYFKNKYGAKRYDWAMHQSVPLEKLNLLRADNTKYVPHHIAHVSNAMYQSASQRALVVSFDGGSDNGHFNIYNTEKGQNPVLILQSKYDLCVPYAAMGQYLFDIKKEEDFWIGNLTYAGKVMGLSSYGKEDPDLLKKSKELFEKQVTDDVGLAHKNWKKISSSSDKKNDSAKNLAFSTQFEFERKFKEIANKTIASRDKNRELIFSGGGSMNIINNTAFKAFVSPNSDDRGLALGCLLHHLRPSERLDSTYLGPLPWDSKPEGKGHTVKSIGNMLKSGKILGLIQGRMEHGARALGNRSILCIPTEGIKDKLNTSVKKREWFRPFAAVCREENASKYFTSYDMHAYMTHNVFCKTNEFPGIMHIDNTCRLQTVTKEQNLFLWKLLGEFPVLLNTSFNIMGKPILNTYREALWMKENTEIDEVITESEIL